MTNKLISIITPSYNSYKFISDTVKSVLNQTYSNWEMIIIDDASTDDSVNIIQGFASSDKRISLVAFEKNVGAAEARNSGLKHAKGDYIAFIDSDDIWEPNKLKSQLLFMIQNNYPISFTSYGVYNEKMENELYVINVPKSIDYHGYMKNTIIGMSTSMINKKLVGDFSFYNIRTRQDTYLWISLLKRGFIAYGLNSNLAKYRKRQDSISGNKLKAVMQVWFLYRKLEKFNFIKSMYYLSFYGYNALKKRK